MIQIRNLSIRVPPHNFPTVRQRLAIERNGLEPLGVRIGEARIVVGFDALRGIHPV
jgi:hypothetical protein